MKKYLFLIFIFIFGCRFERAILIKPNFSNLKIEYKNPIYYKLGDKIYYSRDSKIDKNDTFICDGSYIGGHVSPDYNYIVAQTNYTSVLFNKNGERIKELTNCYLGLIQWGPNSKQILFLKKVSKKARLILFNVANRTGKVVIKNILIPPSKNKKIIISQRDFK